MFENFSHGFIADDLSLVSRVLEIVFADMLPYSFDDLWSGKLRKNQQVRLRNVKLQALPQSLHPRALKEESTDSKVSEICQRRSRPQATRSIPYIKASILRLFLGA